MTETTTPPAAEAPAPVPAAARTKPLWMWICLWLSGGLLALVVLFLVVGMLLPSRYRVERQAVIDARPAVVHAVVADLRTWPEWTAWNTDNYPSLEYEFEGPESGIGAVQKWRADEGTGRLEITASDPQTGIVYELNWGDHPPMHGAVTLEAVDAGTRVTWTAEGDLGSNPISRWFGLLMDSMLGPDHERGLAGLKKRIEG